MFKRKILSSILCVIVLVSAGGCVPNAKRDITVMDYKSGGKIIPGGKSINKYEGVEVLEWLSDSEVLVLAKTDNTSDEGPEAWNQLDILNLNTGAKKILVDKKVQKVFGLSPDKKFAAYSEDLGMEYTATSEPKTGKPTGNINIVNVVSGEKKVVKTNIKCEDAIWFDNKSIMYLTIAGNWYNYELVDLSGNSLGTAPKFSAKEDSFTTTNSLLAVKVASMLGQISDYALGYTYTGNNRTSTDRTHVFVNDYRNGIYSYSHLNNDNVITLVQYNEEGQPGVEQKLSHQLGLDELKGVISCSLLPGNKRAMVIIKNNANTFDLKLIDTTTGRITQLFNTNSIVSDNCNLDGTAIALASYDKEKKSMATYIIYPEQLLKNPSDTEVFVKMTTN